MIQCKNCHNEVAKTLMVCPHCGKNPRHAPPAPVHEKVRPPAAEDASEPGNSAAPTVATAPNFASAPRITLTLPDHTQIELAVGQRLILGRESPDKQVAQAFAGFEDVSRSHVRFVNDEQGPALVMLGDTGGQYGTFLDGRRLPNNKNERIPLQDGDRIRLGEQQAWCIVKVHDS